MLRVHILKPYGDDWLQDLQARLDDSIVLTGGEVDPAGADYDILVAGVPERVQLEASPNLKALVIPWAGLPVKTREMLPDFPDLKVYNIHHNAAPAAEQALALLLATARDTVNIDREFRANNWSATHDNDRAFLLEGRTALILGYGAIGRRIGRTCLALGMKVSAVRRYPRQEPDDPIAVHPAAELKTLLAGAEVLFVCLPLTEDTEGLLAADELALLPDRAIVINVARGKVIDEKAFYDELRRGRIRAGLDVWYCYPRDEPSRLTQSPSDYPFHELPNVVMTPHIGGNSDRTEKLRIAALADLLNRMARSEEPAPIDLTRGY